VFVCDGPSDGSDERLAAWARPRADRVRVLSYPQNRGKGYAVRLGLLEAAGQWRIFTDVDLAYSFDDVERLARRLWEGADVAIASRTHPDARIQLPPRHLPYVYMRHLQSQVFSRLVRWMLPIEQKDTQAGLKGISAKAVERIVPQLNSNGFELDCELLTACARMAIAVAEIPVCVSYDGPTSTVPHSAVWRMLWSLLRIRREWAKSDPLTTRASAVPEIHSLEPSLSRSSTRRAA
jgi:glycosyltransferase involved in cell wall biosynthesis